MSLGNVWMFFEATLGCVLTGLGRCLEVNRAMTNQFKTNKKMLKPVRIQAKGVVGRSWIKPIKTY